MEKEGFVLLDVLVATVILGIILLILVNLSSFVLKSQEREDILSNKTNILKMVLSDIECIDFYDNNLFEENMESLYQDVRRVYGEHYSLNLTLEDYNECLYKVNINIIYSKDNKNEEKMEIEKIIRK